MAAMGLSAQAQLMRSTTFYEKERVPATWYLRAGMSVNNVAEANTFSEETDGSIGSKIGYDVAVGFQKSIKDKGFYWGMEFGLGTRGAKNERSSETYSLKRSFVAHDIKLTPLMFGYKYAFSDVLSLDVHLADLHTRAKGRRIKSGQARVKKRKTRMNMGLTMRSTRVLTPESKPVLAFG